MIGLRSISLNTAINAFAVLFVFSLSGCQTTPQKVRTASTQTTHTEKYIKDDENLKQCQIQLQALKVVNPDEHKRMRNSFDYIMNSAAQYASVRKNVNQNTQSTVDSLYHYRANQLCARIAQTLMESLTTKGEARP